MSLSSLNLEELKEQFIHTPDDLKYEYNPFNITKLYKNNSLFFLNRDILRQEILNSSYSFVNMKTIYNSITDKNENQDIFIKFSPLLDPIRCMTGKYKSDFTDIAFDKIFSEVSSSTILPIKNDITDKIKDKNNASYVDSFFIYLTNELLSKKNIVHGVKYFGSYLGIQQKYKMNIEDDLDCLYNSSYFTKNLNKKFFITENENINNMFSAGSRINKKELLKFSDETQDIELDILDDSLQNNASEPKLFNSNLVALYCDEFNPTLKVNSQSIDTDILSEKFNELILESNKFQENNAENDIEVFYQKEDIVSSDKNDDDINDYDDDDDSSSSDYSEDTDNDLPKFSFTNTDTNTEKLSDNTETISDKDDTEDKENFFKLKTKKDYEDDSETEYTDVDEDDIDVNVFSYIYNFPVQIICQERCDGTIDELFANKLFNSDDEQASALIQVVMTLLIYQRLFQFTHNDLHTNNIMFINTKIENLYYKFNNKIYKVPTYGKIFKIIDFGRSIYKYKGETFCSDSFSKTGDATSQYNFEPFFNDTKPRLEPNMSFDLCRLGCSIYDFIIDEYPHPSIEDEFNETQKTIYRWCMDDQYKNVLYKRNGDERYPDFKLYKMIARTAHNHTPEEELSYAYFSKFEILDDIIEFDSDIMDIDNIKK